MTSSHCNKTPASPSVVNQLLTRSGRSFNSLALQANLTSTPPILIVSDRNFPQLDPLLFVRESLLPKLVTTVPSILTANPFAVLEESLLNIEPDCAPLSGCTGITVSEGVLNEGDNVCTNVLVPVFEREPAILENFVSTDNVCSNVNKEIPIPSIPVA